MKKFNRFSYRVKI